MTLIFSAGAITALALIADILERRRIRRSQAARLSLYIYSDRMALRMAHSFAAVATSSARSQRFNEYAAEMMAS